MAALTLLSPASPALAQTIVEVETDTTIDVSSSALTSGQTATVTVRFGEPLDNDLFEEDELTIMSTGTGMGGTLLSGFGSSDNTTYTAMLTPPDMGEGIITLRVAAGVAQAIEELGEGALRITQNAAARPVTVTYDTEVPTPTITVDNNNLASGETATVTVTFSEAVTGFTEDELTASAGTLTSFSGTGDTYTATLTPPATGSGGIDLDVAAGVAEDMAGNLNTAATMLMVSYTNTVAPPPDTVAPTVTITVSDNAMNGLSSGEKAMVTVRFSEEVTGFIATELTTTAGTLSAFRDAGDDMTYTFDLTPPTTGSGDIDLDVAAGVAEDMAGNLNTAATTLIVSYTNTVAPPPNPTAPTTPITDTVAPTVTITVDNNNLASGETATVTVTFSEAVTGFTEDELTASAGTLTSFSGTGDTYIATLTPPARRTGGIALNVAAGVASDAVGNPNTAATPLTVRYDTDAPTVTIEVSDSDLLSGETATVTVRFSEEVTGFTATELTTTAGSLSAFSGSGAVYTFTITPPPPRSHGNWNHHPECGGQRGQGCCGQWQRSG